MNEDFYKTYEFEVSSGENRENLIGVATSDDERVALMIKAKELHPELPVACTILKKNRNNIKQILTDAVTDYDNISDENRVLAVKILMSQLKNALLSNFPDKNEYIKNITIPIDYNTESFKTKDLFESMGYKVEVEEDY